MSSPLDRLLKDLRNSYQPRCIKPGEDRDTAMHYAGKVELAQKILREYGGSLEEEEAEYVHD